MGTLSVDYIKTSGGGSIAVPDTAGTFDRLQRTGNVLQVVSFLTSAQGSVTVSSTDIALSPDIVKTITPVADNSNFLIALRWAGEIYNGGQWNTVLNIHRDGVRINAPNALNYGGLTLPALSYYSSDNVSTPDTAHLTTLDTTGSTAGTPITYRLVMSASGGYTVWTNRCFGTPGSSQEVFSTEMIITEIAA